MSEFEWGGEDFPRYDFLEMEEGEFEELMEDLIPLKNYSENLRDALDIHDRIIEEEMHIEGYEPEVKNYLRDVGYENGFENPREPLIWLTDQIADEADKFFCSLPLVPHSKGIVGTIIEEDDSDYYNRVEIVENRLGFKPDQEIDEDSLESIYNVERHINQTTSRAAMTGFEHEDRGKLGRILFYLGFLDSTLRTWPEEGYTEETSPGIKYYSKS